MINKYVKYDGPNPKDINSAFPEHTYEKITNLLTGKQCSAIYEKSLIKLGYTKQTYSEKFPGAPLNSQEYADRRSKIMTDLNTNSHEFQDARVNGMKQFYASEEGLKNRIKQSARAKEQHRNGQADYVREYFETKYQGSELQKRKSQRMIEYNPMHNHATVKKAKSTYIENLEKGQHQERWKRRKYKDTTLTYQSRLERHFLEYAESIGILDRVTNGKVFNDELYEKYYYECDFILDDNIAIEIKSWYVEQLQEKNNPGDLNKKRSLVERSGYSFIYLKDKEYSPLQEIL